MTREEAITQYIMPALKRTWRDDRCIEIISAIDQEPCEDAIRRQAVLDLIADYDLSMGQVVNGIHTLPPITPQPKTGHWEQYGDPWEDKFKCSECGKEQPKILCGQKIIGHWSDYCPNCGARMVESQESEEIRHE